MALCCPVIELRQYTLHSGACERLVRLFEEHFVEGQERYGMRIVGQFRDLDAPDHFLWIRGFADMETRARALEGFYSGPVWKEHGPVANATMVDYTNVLLLRPADAQAGFKFDPRLRPSPEAAETDGGLVVATIQHLTVPVPPEELASARVDAGDGTLLGRFVTERARNTYPRLPIREDANVLVTFVSYANTDAYRSSARPSETIARVEHLRLQPTRRSFLRHHPLPSGRKRGGDREEK
jgi:NIPSNAP